MTFSAIITDLKRQIGPGFEQYVGDSGVKTWINSAYMQLVDAISQSNADYFTRSATTNSVAGQQEYDLQTDSERIVMVAITYDGTTWRRVMPLLEMGQVPNLASTSSTQPYTTANPVYYTSGGKIGFLPIPSTSLTAALKVWDVYTPAEMSNDTDVPAIPTRFHHLLKDMAYADYLDMETNHTAAEQLKRRCDQRIEGLIASVSQSQIDQPRSIQITTGQDAYYSSDDYI